MTIADEIYNDPRIKLLARCELRELLADCVNQIGLDDGDRLSKGDMANALFIALGHLPIDSATAVKLRRTIEEHLQ